jgi:beta-1,4-mannosyl-glycoprotein beta-1,4-N-acetylglucosaminyltransferase
MVVDCFPFFNELDLLEVRLNELWPYVDKFFLSEATLTFSNKPKPLYFHNNRDRFKKYESKLVHTIIDDYEGIDRNDPWDMDSKQKQLGLNVATRILRNGDVLICTDLDEIPSGAEISKWFDKKWSLVKLQMPLFYYWMNCLMVGKKWKMCKMLRINGDGTPLSFRKIRYSKKADGNVIGGWHFSYLSDIKLKIDSFAHTEYAKPPFNTPEHIEKMVLEGKDLYGRGYEFEFLDDRAYLPEFVRTNLDVYGKYLC